MPKQYTLQYIGKRGDVIARDYFKSEEELREFADGLIDTYEYFGIINTYGLYMSDDDGVETELWLADIEEEEYEDEE